jgi:RimJ/RimL family protein N-acetyltransferase
MIHLQKTKPEDIPVVMEMENHADNRDFVTQNSLERHLAIIGGSDEEHLKVMDENNKIIGYVILVGLENPNKIIELRRLVIAEKGKGFGRETLQHIKKYCFEQLKCHRLFLDVVEDNLRAQHLYRSEGFVLEGLMREAHKAEKGYKNLLLLSILEHEY